MLKNQEIELYYRLLSAYLDGNAISKYFGLLASINLSPSMDN